MLRLLAGLVAALCLAGAARAQTVSVTLTTPTTTYLAAGGTVTLTANITYSAQPTALGGSILIPAGWTLASTGGTNPPSLVPDPGTTTQLDYAYFAFPAGSAQFTVALNYPAGLTGNQSITSNFQYRTPTQNFAPAAIVLAPTLSATQAVATKSLTAGTAATAFTPVTAANGVPPHGYAISPALPTGLALNATTGAITGTPASASAATTYTVTVTDASLATASQTFSLTVNAALGSTQSIAAKSLTINTAAVAFTPVTISGGTAPFNHAIAPALPAGLSLNAANGSLSGTPTVTSAATTYTVTVTDGAGATTSRTFVLTVNPGPVATQAIASRTLTSGTAAAAFTPVTASGGSSPYTFTVSPALAANLTMNAATGAVTGTPSGASAVTIHTVTVTDSAGATASNTFSLTVNGPVTATPAIASHALTAGTAAVAFTPVTASGGTSPYTYAVAPALPNALALNAATGAITGTPSSASAANSYTVTITDASLATASQTFSLTVNAALSSTQNVASRALTLNTAAVAFTPVTVTGGTAPHAYALDAALPTGLSFNAATGAVTGTPTATLGTATFTVTITDAAGAISSKTFSLTVNAAIVATQVVANRTFTAGAAAATFTPVTASGGTTPHAFSVAPALPAGLVLNAATGAVSGLPSAAAALATYFVTVTDAAGATSSQSFTLAVNGPFTATLTIASQALSAGIPAAAFSPVTAAGGTAPFAFSIAPSLPAGLAFDASTGVITGSATAAFPLTTFTVTVTDASGAMGSRNFSLVVNAAVVAHQAIASRTLSAGTAAVAFTPVTGSAGTVPYSFSISPSLPANLTLNVATGAISGTPSAASPSTTYTITVSDSFGGSASHTFSLLVSNTLAAGAGTISSRTLTAGVAATAFTPLPLIGGALPYAWSVAPALPAGLSLNATTGAITGTPGAALAATNFVITGGDSTSAQVTHTLTLVVNAGVAATQTIASRTLSANTPAAAFAPVSASGGTGPYVFTIAPALPGNLTMDPATGVISGTPSASLATTTFSVTVTDAAGSTAMRTFTLNVNGALGATQTVATMTLTATTLSGAFIPVMGAGGTAPYTYAISPALPAGLSFNTGTGNINGAAVGALATTTFTVTVTDGASATAGNTFSLTVNPALTSTQAVASRVLASGHSVVAFAPVTAADGTPPYSFAITPALPAALAFGTTTGAVSGTPIAALATTTFTVTATDSVGATSSKTFNLTVNGPPTAVAGQTISNRTLTAGTSAVAFTPLPVTGGTLPFTYSVTPALPVGLSLDASTGVITGTAATNLAPVVHTITATDGAGAQVIHALTLVVNPAPIATQVLPSTALPVNVAAAFTPVTVTGGTPPFVFSVSPALASGLSISASTGAIGGTPVVVSDFVTYTVTATDSVGAGASATFRLAVQTPPPVIISATTASGPVNTAFSYTIMGTHSPTSYAAANLPADLSLNSVTGVISGTPTEAGVVSVSLSATNATGPGPVTILTLTINEAVAVNTPPTITSQPQNGGAPVGGSLTLSVTADGTPAPTYQWRKNGLAVAGATAALLALNNFQVGDAGSYSVAVTNVMGGVTSQPAAVGVISTEKVVGAGTEVGQDIVHANGNIYDQVLLTGASATITADPTQITRISYLDLNDDIVQIEYSGPGTLTLTLENATGPAAPLKYNQPGIVYMKGHASLVITGAGESSHLAVFSVGSITAVNQSLFKPGEVYDGIADIGLVSISSPTGRFGGIRTANASYFRASGFTGVHAPGVAVQGPVFVGDINADLEATGTMVFGSTTDVRITGGDLLQLNNRAVQVRGISRVNFTPGAKSGGQPLPAQVNRGRLEQDGVDVTDLLVHP